MRDATSFHVLIPARLESTRLPRKALVDVAGKPLVVRVWERAVAAAGEQAHIATDSDDIARVGEAAGASVIRTAADHDSGTSRLAEAAMRLELADDAIVVNLQGDEPAMPTACLAQVAGLLAAEPDAAMATLWMPMEDDRQWRDPDVVKVVTGAQGRALYFSRAPIPHCRNGRWPGETSHRHVGLYAYRAAALARWRTLPESPLAACESLEQLRALEAGWTIACARACEPVPPGVDTPDDLEAMRRYFR